MLEDFVHIVFKCVLLGSVKAEPVLLRTWMVIMCRTQLLDNSYVGITHVAMSLTDSQLGLHEVAGEPDTMDIDLATG